MKRKNTVSTFVIFFLLFALFLNSTIISSNNQNNENNKHLNKKDIKFKPKMSNGLKSLNYSNIHQNATEIYRGFLKDMHSVNFTVNASGFENVDNMNIQIYFPGNTDETYPMTALANHNFTYTYRPAYDAPLGFHEVKFIVYNSTGSILNTQTTLSNFTVKSNCMIGLDPEKSEYRRGETLETSLIVYDFKIYSFKWNITVVDNVDESIQKNIFNVGNDLFHIKIEINETYEQTNKNYFIKVNMTDVNNNYIRTAVAYFQFKVLLPVSLLTSIIFNPTSIFREQSCNLDTNVSYIQNDLRIELINVSLTLIDTNINDLLLTNNNDGTFSNTFSVDAIYPARRYHYTIKTLYNLEEIEQYKGTISVKNNPPEIDGYEINDYDTDESISVNYGEDLVFEFDVSDIEGVAYITLLLINEDDDEYEISREYESDLEITVRTAELITGTWEIYVYVTDTDGATVGLDDDFDNAPQKITIIPDTLSNILPWIMLIIGLISGILVATGITYYSMKSKKLKYKPEEKMEVLEKRSKKEKKPKKPEPTPTKLKPTKKLIEEEKPEKKELRKPRKIKRKLK
ncbi:MAG: hypothetical protein EU540_03960 [Promethearchaeota archaeon]|nr:MAG: hypothetical protein EU540_03960 [Candidatus Lokiarchaeota archaeon]